MYVLTEVAALSSPPSVITGLFGISVGGTPGVATPWAFDKVVVAWRKQGKSAAMRRHRFGFEAH